MFKKILVASLIVTLFASSNTIAKPTVGEMVTDFTTQDSNGNEFKLSEQKGKIVVLEWTNNHCPFVKKHYDTNNMQELQTKYTTAGVTWVSIISSAEGKQGYLENGEEANKVFADRNSKPSIIIRDPSGEIGRMYQAATTPHMFVINAEGTLVYAGAIDSIASADKGDVEKADNYVAAALDETIAGKPVSKAVTTPYGCSVKY